MPRQRSVGRAAPTRPTAAAKPPAPQQSRPAATMAAPPPAAAAPPPQPMMAQAAPQGPGLFGQMASTAAGVAIGSSVGHAIGGLFSGGSSEPAPAPVAAAAAPAETQNYNNCSGATQNFTKCMDENNGNMQICNWYLEQLKACQAASSQ
ncbi:CHCH domain protein [Thelonectria olida]|uniref:CHCH domain protein n=1 Tax=Thelonectria olida TaxID=1576542 RepID=A0A9P9AIT3_9HYPO|nr:CHCH domain protein [Thelonectria olida]